MNKIFICLLMLIGGGSYSLGAPFPQKSDGVTFYKAAVQKVVNGRHGPMSTDDPDPPVTGSTVRAALTIFGKVKNVKFELVNLSGKKLDQKIKVVHERNNYSINDAMVQFNVPDSPFHILMHGETLTGKKIILMSPLVGNPVKGKLKPLVTEEGAMMEMAKKYLAKKGQTLTPEQSKKMIENMGMHAGKPSGFAEMKVQNVVDEPLVSKKGNMMGIRIRFDVIFPEKTRRSIYPTGARPHDLYKWVKKKFGKEFMKKLVKSRPDNQIMLHSIRRKISPAPKNEVGKDYLSGAGRFIHNSTLVYEKGKYSFEFLMVPEYLKQKNYGTSDLCYVKPGTAMTYQGSHEQVDQLDSEFRFTASIYNTPWTNEANRPPTKFLATRINPAKMHAAILKEGYPNCESRKSTK